MAAAIDASSPARVSGDLNTAGSLVTASFTAPADALLVACVRQVTLSNLTSQTLVDSGGLTWTSQIIRTHTESGGDCHQQIWTARTTSAVARTVTYQRNGTDGGNGSLVGTLKVLVATGIDVDGTPVDSVGAANEGNSTTNNANTSSVTPTANGLLIVQGNNSSGGGAGTTSSDLTLDQGQQVENYPSATHDTITGYKAVSSGVGATGNMDGQGAAAASHSWIQIVLREAAGGGGGGPVDLISLNRNRSQRPGGFRP